MKEPLLTIAISTDILAIPRLEQSKNRLVYLLEGENNDGFLAKGPANVIYQLIDDCYKAREGNYSIELCFPNQDKVIIFE